MAEAYVGLWLVGSRRPPRWFGETAHDSVKGVPSTFSAYERSSGALAMPAAWRSARITWVGVNVTPVSENACVVGSILRARSTVLSGLGPIGSPVVPPMTRPAGKRFNATAVWLCASSVDAIGQ